MKENEIQKKIECLRKELEESYLLNQMRSDKHVIALSHKLDVVILEYYSKVQLSQS